MAQGLGLCVEDRRLSGARAVTRNRWFLNSKTLNPSTLYFGFLFLLNVPFPSRMSREAEGFRD